MMRYYTIVFKSIIAITLGSLLGGCGNDIVAPKANWQLIWQQEFDGVSGAPVNGAVWNYDIGNGTDGWGNFELQYYTDRTENVSLDGDGNLAITARRENFSGSNYTSGRINTKTLFEQAYGRFEARIQLPFGRGLWPAFWMLGNDIDAVDWPQCGEIDIMEYRGQEPTIIHGSMHGPGYSGANPVTDTYQLVNDRFDTGFHIFAVEWFEDRVDYFVDGEMYQRITRQEVPGQWVFDHPFYILLNVAVGGSFAGPPDINTPFPQTMLVDWIRVYEKKDS